MMKALDQIISSTGMSRTSVSKTRAGTEWLNHASSTTATPLPEL
jgi:hypothetical protein